MTSSKAHHRNSAQGPQNLAMPLLEFL